MLATPYWMPPLTTGKCAHTPSAAWDLLTDAYCFSWNFPVPDDLCIASLEKLLKAKKDKARFLSPARIMLAPGTLVKRKPGPNRGGAACVMH